MKETSKKIETEQSKIINFLIEKKDKILNYLTLLVIIISCYFALKHFYLIPLEEEATNEIYFAENFFAKDSFEIALKGSTSFKGFEVIADEYSFTKSGNLANYYAGICEMKLKNYEKAIEYFNDFDTDDKIFESLKNGLMGDAYSELENYDKASKSYELVVKNLTDDYFGPIFLFKLSLSLEKAMKYDEAIKKLKIMELKYPEVRRDEVDKLLGRIEALKNK